MNFLEAVKKASSEEGFALRPIGWRGKCKAFVFSGPELLLWDQGLSALKITVGSPAVSESGWNSHDEFLLALGDLLGEWEVVESDALMSELDQWIGQVMRSK